METRIPLRFANYHGDHTHMIGDIKGPNALGELLVAVTAAHHTESDTTRVGFAYATTHDITAALDAAEGQIHEVAS